MLERRDSPVDTSIKDMLTRAKLSEVPDAL